MSGRDEAAGGAQPRRIGVQPFDRDMVRVHLDAKGLRYLVDQDGDFRVEFAPVAEDAPALTVQLSATGTNQEVLLIQVVANVGVEKTMWDKVLRGCNQWNMQSLFPKAYLQIPTDLSALVAPIILEGEFPLGAGVTQPMVDDYIEAILGSSLAFWQWAPGAGLLVDDSSTAAD